MAFARKEVKIEALRLKELTPAQVERKIIDGVKKYATKTENWEKADRNTPFLGQVVGMGIESASLVDITMSIERQFLTKKTVKVPAKAEGRDFDLEDGKTGQLVIYEGQDTFVATPGLAVKLLMEYGHMPADPSYIEGVISFGYVVVTGEGYRINDALQKAMNRIDTATEDKVKAEWRQALNEQIPSALSYLEDLANPARLSEQRMQAFFKEQERVDVANKELDSINKEMEKAANDIERASWKSKAATLKLRMGKSKIMLKVAEAVGRDCRRRSKMEEEAAAKVSTLLQATLKKAEGYK